MRLMGDSGELRKHRRQARQKFLENPPLSPAPTAKPQ